MPETRVLPAARALQVRGEQIRVVYRHLPAVLVTNVVVGSATVYGLWGVVSHVRLLAWAAAMLVVLAVRTALSLAYRRAAEPLRNRWGTAFAVGSGASGALWGIAGVVLFPSGSLEYQLFILFVLMGMGAGAISSLTAYMPAFHAFLPVSLLPIGVMLLLQNDRIRIALGVMTIIYAWALAFFGGKINKAFVESLSLRFENIDLVQALSEQRDAAERANIAKSKFLAAASHDLRQPLQSLALFTSALDEMSKYPEVTRVVGNINASVRALEELFNALLDISRLDAGVLQPSMRHFRLQEVFARLLNDYVPETERKGLRLEVSPCELVVRSDSTLLERILRNYVSNAIRYTLEGQVRVSCEQRGERVRIEVADTGIGIPADQHREIFSEFYQIGNPERDRTKGLGLGLAIVDRAARLLAHTIGVESTPGAGSCFFVEVPLGDEEEIVAEAPAADTRTADLAGLKVLVVDDEISIREGMQALLAQWGCEVALAASEEEAVAAARVWGTPGAIVVDYRLGEERTGVQAIDRLRREFGASIPVLIISGDTAAERLREVSATGYQLVHKPVQPAMLRAFLRNACARQRAPGL